MVLAVWLVALVGYFALAELVSVKSCRHAMSSVTDDSRVSRLIDADLTLVRA